MILLVQLQGPTAFPRYRFAIAPGMNQFPFQWPCRVRPVLIHATGWRNWVWKKVVGPFGHSLLLGPKPYILSAPRCQKRNVVLHVTNQTDRHRASSRRNACSRNVPVTDALGNIHRLRTTPPICRQAPWTGKRLQSRSDPPRGAGIHEGLCKGGIRLAGLDHFSINLLILLIRVQDKMVFPD